MLDLRWDQIKCNANRGNVGFGCETWMPDLDVGLESFHPSSIKDFYRPSTCCFIVPNPYETKPIKCRGIRIYIGLYTVKNCMLLKLDEN